jgi:hypothetical protein
MTSVANGRATRASHLFTQLGLKCDPASCPTWMNPGRGPGLLASGWLIGSAAPLASCSGANPLCSVGAWTTRELLAIHAGLGIWNEIWSWGEVGDLEYGGYTRYL